MVSGDIKDAAHAACVSLIDQAREIGFGAESQINRVIITRRIRTAQRPETGTGSLYSVELSLSEDRRQIQPDAVVILVKLHPIGPLRLAR